MIQGLKQRVGTLENVISEQNKTFTVMERRIEETERIGSIYKNLISDLPNDIENYKTIVSKTKDATILELRSQQELTAQKLEQTELKLQAYDTKQIPIAVHLKILRNLLGKNDRDTEFTLTKIFEADGLSLERSIPVIAESGTLEICLMNLGISLFVSEEVYDFRKFYDKKVTPKGEPLRTAHSQHSITTGYHLMANRELYMNQVRFDELETEFRSIKMIA